MARGKKKPQSELHAEFPTKSEVLLRDYILGGLAWVYLWAFSSLYYQIPGLYGDSGVQPVQSKLTCDFKKDLLKCALTGDAPNGLYAIRYVTDVSPVKCMELACLAGIALSSLAIIFRGFRDFIIFGLLWYAYFSCFQVGGIFLWFQWDTLLLEMGFLALVLAPVRIIRSRSMPHDFIGLFLLRWLAFRLMFASGVVKLQSDCPTWWSLTALVHHYQSQCLPTPLAWYAHQVPEWMHKLACALTYLIEIGLPLWFLMPFKSARKVAFCGQVFLMAAIVATGNYNFFNFAYLVACMAMLATSDKSKYNSNIIGLNRLGRPLYLFIKAILLFALWTVTLYMFIKLFNIKLDWNDRDWTKSKVLSSIAFKRTDLDLVMKLAMPWILVTGSYLFVTECLMALVRSFDDESTKFRKIVSIVFALPTIVVATLLFGISLVPFTSLLPPQQASSLLIPDLYKWHQMSEKYQISHAYGLFRRMTGVSGRPELIIEGASQETGPWLPYEFLYKPGKLDRMPAVNAPHQPRLDWQMWFAALGSIDNNPWLVSFVYRLLSNEKDVLALLYKNPFPAAPPKFIRINHYKYRFTTPGSKTWWQRDDERVYLTPVSIESPMIQGVITKVQKKSRDNLLVTQLVDYCRIASKFVPDGATFVWAISGLTFLNSLLMRRFF